MLYAYLGSCLLGVVGGLVDPYDSISTHVFQLLHNAARPTDLDSRRFGAGPETEM